jgi:hypothetical protein
MGTMRLAGNHDRPLAEPYSLARIVSRACPYGPPYDGGSR